MQRILKSTKTEQVISTSLASYLEKQYDLYPHDLEVAMLEAIWTESEDAPALTESFLQQFYKFRYSQEMPAKHLAELACYLIGFVRKTPKDRLLKFFAYTLESKIKEVNHRTL